MVEGGDEEAGLKETGTVAADVELMKLFEKETDQHRRLEDPPIERRGRGGGERRGRE